MCLRKMYICLEAIFFILIALSLDSNRNSNILHIASIASMQIAKYRNLTDDWWLINRCRNHKCKLYFIFTFFLSVVVVLYFPCLTSFQLIYTRNSVVPWQNAVMPEIFIPLFRLPYFNGSFLTKKNTKAAVQKNKKRI